MNLRSYFRQSGLLSFLMVGFAVIPIQGVRAGDPPPFETPFGLGLLAGRTDLENHYAIAFEGQNHFKQRRALGGYRQYGHAETRLEVGNGIGVRLMAIPGFTVYGLPPAGGTLSPHVGFEPISGRLTANSHSDWANYYEWMPMVSLGAQWGFSHACRWLPLARIGAGAGNLGNSGWRPSLRLAYGVGTYLNCSRLDAALDVTRLVGGDQNLSLATVDIAYVLQPQSGLRVAVRVESDLGRGGREDGNPTRELTEQRLLISVRGDFISWN